MPSARDDSADRSAEEDAGIEHNGTINHGNVTKFSVPFRSVLET